MDTHNSDVNWSFGKKLWFRYLFIFFGLIIFPFPLTIIPGADVVTTYYDQVWTAMINLAGKTFFGLEKDLELAFTGSGDGLYSWLWYFCLIILTLTGGTIWSILDQKRTNYNRLRSWLVLFATYYLIYFLFFYGIVKLFYLQFSAPNMERLFQTYGQSSPMRLIWTFMGYSKTYTVFSGFCETFAGVWLLFRRTRTLGALLTISVMLNVFLMNMSYDVPVKLFSFQLMLIGFFLAALDYKRLIAFFFLNQTAPPSVINPIFKSQRGRWILLGAQVLLVGFMLYSIINTGISGQKQYGSKRPKSALYGVYNVEHFIQNRDTLPPLLTDTVRWRRILFDYQNFTSIMLMDEKVKRYDSVIDTVAHTIEFAPRGDSITTYPFTYILEKDLLSLTGIIEQDTLQVELKNYPLEQFGLLNRGFNWINEVPYNRYNYD